MDDVLSLDVSKTSELTPAEMQRCCTADLWDFFRTCATLAPHEENDDGKARENLEDRPRTCKLLETIVSFRHLTCVFLSKCLTNGL